LRKELAAQIAALLDGGELAIEGVMPGKRGAYTMPVSVACYGPSAAIVPGLTRRLLRANIDFEPVTPEEPTLGIPGFGASPRERGRGKGGKGGGVTATARVLSPKQMETALDRLFEGMCVE
jgi:hypothetical protein